MARPIDDFAPNFSKDEYTKEDLLNIGPFFTNLDKSVYVPLIFSPELVGALCSRTSRAPRDLRHIFLHEFVYPFINPVRIEKDTDQSWNEKVRYGQNLNEFIKFLNKHPILDLFSNPKARSFYATWLAQYGDDSIAQMAGMHLVFCGISQIAIKHPEDQRIALAPIEKSTRYVNYGQKIKGRYQYYVDPTLQDLGLIEKYCLAMDNLFYTYARLQAPLTAWLSNKFPSEKPSVIEKKVFDTLRGLLPMATLSQVAFFGNGQSFEHLINRSMKHHLGEIRWLGHQSLEQLNQISPSFLRRIQDETKKDVVEKYQDYLAGKNLRVNPLFHELASDIKSSPSGASVFLVECDPKGEDKVITGILYSARDNNLSWASILARVSRMSQENKSRILDAYLQNRDARWQKIGRAFENVYSRFEIVMNIGAWRDLHRHQMLTQQRQTFSCYHGYDIPQEITESGLEGEFSSAINQTEDIHEAITRKDPELAQYAVTMAHRVRFMQWENLRQSFWQIELRTIPEGHPDYRHVEQEKFRLLQRVYPLLSSHMLVNMGEYDFARRGQEEKIQTKLDKLKQ